MMAEPTLERLESAFMKAHSAGDKVNAKILADEIKRRRAVTPSPSVSTSPAASIDYVAADAETDAPTPASMARERMAALGLAVPAEQTAAAQKVAPGIAREAISGLTFGSIDEILGGLRGAQSVLTGGDFMPAAQDTMAKFRGQREQFKKEYPKTAIASEIAGSVPTGLYAGGKLLATQAAKQFPRLAPISVAAGEGGAYGLLSAEGNVPERLPEAAIGTVAGGLLRGAGEYLPRVTEPARKLIAEKIEPTVGQAFGPLIKKAEERLGSVPILGDVIRGGQKEVIESFDNRMIEKALEPIGFKVPAGKTGVEAMEAAEEALADSYRKAIPKAGLPDARPLQTKINEIVQDNTDLEQGVFKQLREKLNKSIASSLFDTDYKMTGEAVKKADSFLGREAAAFMKTGDPDKQQMARALYKFQNELRNLLINQNPSAKGLVQAREAFKGILPIRKAATSSAKDVGTFTPAQLLGGMKQVDKSSGRTRFATGQMPEQKFAMTAQEVLGKSVPESQSIGAAMLLKPSLIPLSGLGAIAAQPFYQTRLGRKAARTALQTPGAVLRGASEAFPTIPGMAGGLLAGEQDTWYN